MTEEKRVTPEEAWDLMEDEGYVYVDVRTVAEFEGGHPEGAYNVPYKLAQPGGTVENPDFVRVMTSAFAKDTALILGCRSGGRSLAAVKVLKDAGFSKVTDQLAGFGGAKDAAGATIELGWQAAGLPATITAEEGRDYDSLKSE